jgi:hypothetical protein
VNCCWDTLHNLSKLALRIPNIIKHDLDIMGLCRAPTPIEKCDKMFPINHVHSCDASIDMIPANGPETSRNDGITSWICLHGNFFGAWDKILQTSKDLRLSRTSRCVTKSGGSDASPNHGHFQLLFALICNRSAIILLTNPQCGCILERWWPRSRLLCKAHKLSVWANSNCKLELCS